MNEMKIFTALDSYPSEKVENLKPGVAIIFYVDEFKKEKKEPPFKKNADDLHEVLSKIGFEVKIFPNLTEREARDVLEEYSQRNYSDAVCFLAVFISHGTDGKIVMKKDRLDVGEHIIRTFNGKNCEGLRDKPKIFIVATCQGEENEDYFRRVKCDDDAADSAQIDTDENPLISYIPVLADFLVCFGSTKGCKAFYNRNFGSWLIHAFVKVLNHFSEMSDSINDFADLMTLVTRNVTNHWKENKKKNILIHTPTIVSTLRYKIKLPIIQPGASSSVPNTQNK